MNKNSFKHGYSQVRRRDSDKVKRELMQLFEVTHDVSWYRKLNGEQEHSQLEREAVERLFKKYGITDVWGDE